MRRRHLLVSGLLLVVTVLIAGAVAWWVVRTRSQSFQAVMAGGRSTSGNFSVSGGNLFLVSGKPAVLFGTVTKPGVQEEFTYVLVFRHGLSASDLLSQMLSIDFQNSGSEENWGSRDALTLGGKRIEAAYQVKLNDTKTAVASESLVVGGESKELAAGQVFLVDLAAEPPTYRQKRVNLPTPVSPLQSTADVARLAETIVKTLETEDPEIKDRVR